MWKLIALVVVAPILLAALSFACDLWAVWHPRI